MLMNKSLRQYHAYVLSSPYQQAYQGLPEAVAEPLGWQQQCMLCGRARLEHNLQHSFLLQEEWRGEIVHLSWSPRAFIVKNFLSDEECDHLINKASTKASQTAVCCSTKATKVCCIFPFWHTQCGMFNWQLMQLLAPCLHAFRLTQGWRKALL